MRNRTAGIVLSLFLFSFFSAPSASGQMLGSFTTLSGAPQGASAHLWMLQRNGRTTVLIFVRNSSPNTLYTAWIRLAAASPLTDKTVAPLANPDDISALAAVTPAANLTATANALGLFGENPTVGTANLANGFHTNAQGNGLFYANLDFPITRGAFQFGEFDDSLNPVALNRQPAFTIRLAAHPDGTAHGLVPDVHTPSFDWSW